MTKSRHSKCSWGVHLVSSYNNGFKGFTLAEVLITLGIIGVVAALTIPLLSAKINDKVKSTRITTINTKLKQGTDKLMTMGNINGYSSTEDFVKALSEHMKISAYCTKLEDCYPYDKINVEGADEPVEVKDLDSPKAFGLSEDTWLNPVSFVTADGTPYIIMYKKVCDIDDGNGRSNSTGCIAGIYDWNGASTPNKFTTKIDGKTQTAESDIQFLGTITQLANYKVAPDGYFEPEIDGYKSFKILGNDYVDSCSGCTTYEDYWEAAKQACKDIEMELITPSTFNKMGCQYHGSMTPKNEQLKSVIDNLTYYYFVLNSLHTNNQNKKFIKVGSRSSMACNPSGGRISVSGSFPPKDGTANIGTVKQYNLFCVGKK